MYSEIDSAGRWYLGLRVRKARHAIETEAEEHGIPGEIGEKAQLVLLKITGGVPKLEVDILVVNSSSLVEKFILSRAVFLQRELC